MLIKHGTIQSILSVPNFQIEELMTEYLVEDLGDLYVSPGLVDINLHAGEDGLSSVTKAAALGGVTCVATSNSITSSLYCDVAPLGFVSQDDCAFGFKTHLLKDSLKRVQEVLKTKPVLVFPEYPEQVTEVQSPIKEANCENSESDDESTDRYSDLSFENFAISDFFTGPQATPKNDRRGSAPVITLPKFATDRKVSFPRMPRHSVFCTLNMPVLPVPRQDVPFIEKAGISEESYYQHLENFPAEFEVAAVQKLLPCSGKVHFSNVSSALTVETIQKFKPSCEVTFEVSLPYLYFCDRDLKPCDTRYKIVPPIRNYDNYLSLWELFKDKQIDCVGSYHQPVSPLKKFRANYHENDNGMSCIGFTLQGVWTKLRSQIMPEEDDNYLVYLSEVLSKKPSEILGLKHKGSIKVGNDADLVVWDPYFKFTVEKTNDKHPNMNVFKGEELYGAVYRTYVRGQLVQSSPVGCVLNSDN